MEEIYSYETGHSDHKAFQIKIKINTEVLVIGSNTRWIIDHEDRNRSNKWLIE